MEKFRGIVNKGRNRTKIVRYLLLTMLIKSAFLLVETVLRRMFERVQNRDEIVFSKEPTGFRSTRKESGSGFQVTSSLYHFGASSTKELGTFEMSDNWVNKGRKHQTDFIWVNGIKFRSIAEAFLVKRWL